MDRLMNTQSENDHPDYRIIVDLVSEGSSVLDLGCGNGDLLQILIAQKHIVGRGIEIDEQAIYKCVEKGVSVFHGDIDSGVADYPDRTFDFVILNQTLQQVKHLEAVLADALRIGKKVILGFPNFAYIKSRFQISLSGRTPVTASLPYMWYSTPNLHFFSIADFDLYCKEKKIRTEGKYYLRANTRVNLFPNLLADTAIYLLSSSASF